jgi:uncharacterized membrane protein
VSRAFVKLAVLLIGSSGFSVALLFSRMWYSGSDQYVFMIWNLFLAWIPLVVAGVFAYLPQVWQRKWWVLLAVLGAWLLFFPNALYIVTDLWHLKTRDGAPVWLDILLLFSFSWNGLILAFLSLFLIQDFLEKWWGSLKSWFLVSSIIVLSSFGVYLGRFLRWNSWDIVTNPSGLLYEVAGRVLTPWEHTRSTAFTVMYGVFFWFAYVQVRLLFIFKESKRATVKAPGKGLLKKKRKA